MKYTVVPFKYDGKEVLVKLDETSFKVYKNNKDGKLSYSIAASVDHHNKRFFTKLESKIRALISNPKIDLIKNRETEYPTVSLKVYPKSDGTMNCTFRSEVNGAMEKMNPSVLEDTNFYGACVFKVADFFDGSIKSVRLYPKEFLVAKVEDDYSFFEDIEE